MNKRVTISDVAKAAGVAKSTVSFVLNARRTAVPISEKTRRKVLRAVEECGYHPNAAARALSCRRTGHIGFILSDAIADGWSNAYFSACLAGVEAASRRLGYGLNISLYNLSNVDKFVFPARVGQRSVDGVILAGYVASAIVCRFREFGVPCVVVGDNVEAAKIVPTVSADVVAGLCSLVEYGAALGHRRIMCDLAGSTRRGREVGDLALERLAAAPATRECEIIRPDVPNDAGNYASGKQLFDCWFRRPRAQRPSLLIASDQALLAFLQEAARRGVRCPDDVSVISFCDTTLCQHSTPPLTALSCNITALGEYATEMLIKSLEANHPLAPEDSRNDFPCELVVRESCLNLAAGRAGAEATKEVMPME